MYLISIYNNHCSLSLLIDISFVQLEEVTYSLLNNAEPFKSQKISMCSPADIIKQQIQLCIFNKTVEEVICPEV